MRFLSLRTVRSTIAREDITKKQDSIIRDNEIVWEESGFAVEAEVQNILFPKACGTRRFRRTYGPIELNSTGRTSDNDTTLTIELNSTGRTCDNDSTPTYLFNSDGSIEAWLEKKPKTPRDTLDIRREIARVVFRRLGSAARSIGECFEKQSATSSESRYIRKEVARVVLQSLQCEEEQTEDNNGDSADRYSIEVRREKEFSRSDKYCVPDRTLSTTISELGSNTFELYDTESEAVEEVNRERESIREAIFRSISAKSEALSMGTEIVKGGHREGESIPEVICRSISAEREASSRRAKERGTLSIGNFWILTGLTCCHEPKVSASPNPMSNGDGTIYIHDDAISQQFSALSY
jgi:hypothetical protein